MPETRGRPTKYRAEYCDQVIEACKEGKSLTAFAAEIGVCRETISEWTRVHEEFSASTKIAKAHCAAWWESRARSLATSKDDGNPALVIFGLKNMAPDDWRDIQHVENRTRAVISARPMSEDEWAKEHGE